jgi:hypothetical protein
MDITKFNKKGNDYFYNDKKLKVSLNSQGYSRVYIEKKAKRLHRLIAIKYIENIKKLPVVDHIDNDKNNNEIYNLQWLSYSCNSKKAYLQNPNMVINGKRIDKPIISQKDNIKVEHKSLRICAKFIKRDVAGVHRVLKGEWNLCNGYKLTYK